MRTLKKKKCWLVVSALTNVLTVWKHLFSRKSIAEMKKDHEDQINRLKKLKAEEIDAVTSATSQTRWVHTMKNSNMLKKSLPRSQLQSHYVCPDLSQLWLSRWNSSPLGWESFLLGWRAHMKTPPTAWSRGHGTGMSSSEVHDTHTLIFLQMGQDPKCLKAQLRWVSSGSFLFVLFTVMQERLAQQQKTTAEERTYLKEIISRMDAQLNEQQRQLEKVRANKDWTKIRRKNYIFMGRRELAWFFFFIFMPQERWKITAEQAKAESTQRGLEEERRSLSVQINMEREELERAKVRLTNIHISASYQVQDVWVSDTVWYTYWMCIIQYLFLSEVAGFCRSTIWNLHDGVTCLAFMTLNLIVHSQLLPILVFYYGFFSKCIHNRSRDIFRVLEK